MLQTLYKLKVYTASNMQSLCVKDETAAYKFKQVGDDELEF